MKSDAVTFTGKFSTPRENFNESCGEILRKFNESEVVLRATRNTLKVIDYEDKACVVKAFKIPKFPQNYAYGLFADSKAKKSFNNAQQLMQKGFHTPSPIGYFEKRKSCKLTTSYYLCEHTKEAITLESLAKQADEITSEFIQQFAHFSSELHNKGIFHRDFNGSNILVDQTDSTAIFSLVDINRISWYKKLPLSVAMQSMSRLYFSPEIEAKILHHYADLSHQDLDTCLELLKKSKDKTLQHFKNKKRLRKIFPKK